MRWLAEFLATVAAIITVQKTRFTEEKSNFSVCKCLNRYYFNQLTSDLLGYPDGWNNQAYCNNCFINQIDFWGALSLDAKLTSLFVYRVLLNTSWAGKLTNWIWDSYSMEDENHQLENCIAIAVRNHIGVIENGATGSLTTNIASCTDQGYISFTDGLAGFWLSSSAHVDVNVTYQRQKGLIVLSGTYCWYDTVDGNSFPGIAYLKGEGKNVYDNEGDWISRIIQTIEGCEDLFLETGINHVQFGVSITGTFSGVLE